MIPDIVSEGIGGPAKHGRKPHLRASRSCDLEKQSGNRAEIRQATSDSFSRPTDRFGESGLGSEAWSVRFLPSPPPYHPPPIQSRSWAWVGQKIDFDSVAKLMRTSGVPTELFRGTKKPIPIKAVLPGDFGESFS